LRVFDGGKSRACPDLHPGARTHVDAADLLDAPYVHQVGGWEQTLLHRRQQICAAGKNLDVGSVLHQVKHSVLDALRTKKFECRNTHTIARIAKIAIIAGISITRLPDFGNYKSSLASVVGVVMSLARSASPDPTRAAVAPSLCTRL